MSDIEIYVVRYDSLIARRMVAAAMEELVVRYGGSGDETPVDATDFDAPSGAFLVASIGGEPVGCGGWRSHDHDGQVAELKRMFTTGAARGRGVARAMLAAVERSAYMHGRKRMILECGDRQPEAIALYESSGYERIEDFGFYRDQPGVRSYGRDLL